MSFCLKQHVHICSKGTLYFKYPVCRAFKAFSIYHNLATIDFAQLSVHIKSDTTECHEEGAFIEDQHAISFCVMLNAIRRAALNIHTYYIYLWPDSSSHLTSSITRWRATSQ